MSHLLAAASTVGHDSVAASGPRPKGFVVTARQASDLDRPAGFVATVTARQASDLDRSAGSAVPLGQADQPAGSVVPPSTAARRDDRARTLVLRRPRSDALDATALGIPPLVSRPLVEAPKAQPTVSDDKTSGSRHTPVESRVTERKRAPGAGSRVPGGGFWPASGGGWRSPQRPEDGPHDPRVPDVESGGGSREPGDVPGGGEQGPRLPSDEISGDDGPSGISGYEWNWDYFRWLSLRDAPEKAREAESISELGKKYRKVRIKFKAPKGTQRAAVARMEALNVQTGKWELVDLPPAHRRRLARIGIGVVTEEAESVIGKWLPSPTQLDQLADLAKVLLAPETLMPKVLGILAESVARHAGMPGFVARWIGDAVEQATSPLFEPEGTRNALLAGIEDFTVISDLGAGQVTSAVLSLALDRLADELKKKAKG